MAPHDYTLILKHLEKLEGKIDTLSIDLQKTNLEMTKISGMKHALNDIKSWKTNVENAVNAEDLKEMKKALSEIKTATEDMDKIESDIKALKDEKKTESNSLKTEIDNLKTFKTKAVTTSAIVVFLMSMIMTILGWYLS